MQGIWIGLLVNSGSIENPQPFGTFGGSKRYAKKIVAMIPEHKTYVEPFAGGAAVLYAKEPSEREVIADNDANTIYLHRAIKRMTPEFVRELKRRFDWVKRPGSFERALSMKPKDDIAKFFKLAFIRRHAFNRIPTNLTANRRFGQYTDPKKYLRAANRLRDVTILRQDYRKTIRQFDRPSTFFFIDPPYPGEWFDRSNVIDLDEFAGVLSGIRGKFISVINQTPENMRAFKKIGRVFRLKVQEVSGQNGTRYGRSEPQPGGSKYGMRLFVANFPLKQQTDFYVKQAA